MQLPKYKKRTKVKLKICQEPGCGVEEYMHPIQKYCKLHKDIRMRVRKKKKHEAIDVKNMIFKHEFIGVTKVEFICYLDGCKNKFINNIYPKQYIYPKYCEEHRVEFKRELFLKKQKTEQKCYQNKEEVSVKE